MGSILKRISPISNLKTKLINKQAKITFNIDEPEFILNNKFGFNSSINNVVNGTTDDTKYSNIKNNK